MLLPCDIHNKFIVFATDKCWQNHRTHANVPRDRVSLDRRWTLPLFPPCRNVCLQKFPHSLPKLLQSISWNNRSEVAQVYILLQRWKRLRPEGAMELLDYQFADVSVRTWVVECMEVLR